MKHFRLLLLPILIAPALLSLGAEETTIEFKPREGAVVKRTFTTRSEMTLDSMDMTVNGQAPPMMPSMDMTVTTEATTVVEDKLSSVRDGRIARLERSFVDIDQRTEMVMEIDMMGQVQSQDMDMAAESALAGETVVFAWNEQTEEYTPAWPAGKEGKPELLKNLMADMDMVGLLPAGPVTEGQSWEVPTRALMPIMAPGGDLKLVPKDLDPQMGMMSPQSTAFDWFGEGLTGTVTATFEGLREGGLGAIRIRFELKNAVDLTSMMEESMSKIEMPPEAGEIDFKHLDMEIEYDGEGLLLWNLAEGRASSFESSGDFGMIMDIGMQMKNEGMDMELEQMLEMSGSLNQTARFE